MSTHFGTALSQQAQEILAMPASEYMGEAQLSFFRSLLCAKKEELLVELVNHRQRLTELGVAADELDRALIEEERQSIGRHLERVRTQLDSIAHSLRAIAEGEYGWCEMTGEEIGIKRLIAQPTARYSATAQAEEESKARHYHTAA